MTPRAARRIARAARTYSTRRRRERQAVEWLAKAPMELVGRSEGRTVWRPRMRPDGTRYDTDNERLREQGYEWGTWPCTDGRRRQGWRRGYGLQLLLHEQGGSDE